MPRTIESILACYQAARSRRAQGLSSWAKHISLRQPAPQYVSYGDISREDLQNAAASHEEVLRREFSEILDITKVDISNGSARGALSLTGADFAKYLESYVDELYDWADANRVWGEFVFPEDGAPAAST